MNAGSLDFWWQAAGTAPWHEEQVAALGTGSPGPSMFAAPDSVLITVPDASGNVDLWWQQYGTTPWGEQEVAAG